MQADLTGSRRLPAATRVRPLAQLRFRLSTQRPCSRDGEDLMLVCKHDPARTHALQPSHGHAPSLQQPSQGLGASKMLPRRPMKPAHRARMLAQHAARRSCQVICDPVEDAVGDGLLSTREFTIIAQVSDGVKHAEGVTRVDVDFVRHQAYEPRTLNLGHL